MNTLDLIVISVVGLSALFAFVRGFVREALSIVAWIGAGLVAYYGFERFAPGIGRLIPNPLAAQLTTAGLLFVVSLLVFSIIVGVISDRVRMSRLGSVDRSLGLVFGLVRGALVVCLGYLVTVHILEPDSWPPKNDELPAWIAEARSKPYLEQGATPLLRLLPPNLLDQGAKAAKSIESAAKAKDMLDKTVDPPPPAKNQPPAYDSTKRQDLDQTIDQINGKQN
jgi:membrane protein required for colicin V production